MSHTLAWTARSTPGHGSARLLQWRLSLTRLTEDQLSDPKGDLNVLSPYFRVEGCKDAPTPDEVAAALIASGITSKDTPLFACLLRQIYTSNTIVLCGLPVDIQCYHLNSRSPNTGGFAKLGCLENPTHEVGWCHFNKFKGKCGAQALLHELAHTCGWNHGDDKGVPGDSGELSCD